MNKRVRQVMFYAGLLLVWEVIYRIGFWPPYLFPSPASVLKTLIRGAADRTLIVAVAVSLRRIFIGYSFSLVAGILTGILLATLNKVDETVGPVLLGIRTLPSICWLPIGLLWFGLNETAILFVVVMGASFSIALATCDGIRNIPPIFLKVARTMGSSGSRRYFTVVIPAALPSIITGMKLGWAFAWRSLMAGEMLFVSLGLGHLLMMGRELNDISQVIAVMIVILLIGISVDRFLMGALENRIRRRWGIPQG